jgi:hypothetical protein
VGPLDETISQPCPKPINVINTVKGTSIGSDEIRLGRLGDALIQCGAEKEIIVNAYKQVAKIIKK